MTKKLSHTSPGVVHHTTNRTRIKVPKSFHHSGQVNAVKKVLQDIPGVHDVQVNAKTGSITVLHELDHDIFESMENALIHVAKDIIEVMVETEEVSMGGLGLAAAGLALGSEILKNLFGTEEDGTARKFPIIKDSLRPHVVLPVALLAAGVYKAYETKTIWSGVAPAVLFYWAFDSYWKLNHQHSQATMVESRN